MGKKGFTLVELSIVLVIIGLLIGGVLVGQSIISSARIKSAIKQVEQYGIAANLYKQKFKYLPGDDPNAYKKFGTTCLGHTGFSPGYEPRCTNPLTTSGYSPGDSQIDCTQNLPEQECTLFWRHLELGGFIPHPKNIFNAYTGVRHNITYYPNASGGQIVSYPAGYSVPILTSYDLGIISIGFVNSIGSYTTIHNKNAFVLGGDDHLTQYNSGIGAIPLIDAAALDQKIDDGNPTTGKVVAKLNAYAVNDATAFAFSSTAKNYSVDNNLASYNFTGQKANLYIMQDW